MGPSPRHILTCEAMKVSRRNLAEKPVNFASCRALIYNPVNRRPLKCKLEVI